jgi:hypothetical protein
VASTAPSRSPAPSPTIRAGCDNVTTQGCFLAAGAHRTAAYAPEITYTVPSGWMTTNDAPSAFALAPATHENLASLDASGSSLTTINIERDLALAPETCTGSAGAALPRTADAIVRGLAQRQGMLAGVPAPVSLGGLSGWTVDLRVNPVGPRPNCTSRNGTSGIPELIGPGPISHEAFDLAPGVIQRLIVLDLPGGGNVTILISAQKADLWDAFLGQATPVVDSFSFSQAG